jgi:hypothetical protein
VTEAIIDRERALVTARSILANGEWLELEGLDAAGREEVIEIAERLTDQLGDPGLLDDVTADGLTRRLREIMGRVEGRTSGVLTVWLDSALPPSTEEWSTS